MKKQKYKCCKCGNDTREQKVFTAMPANILGKIRNLFGIKVAICETCISSLFKSCRKDK